MHRIGDSLGHAVGVIEFGFVAGGADGDGRAGAQKFFPRQGGCFAMQFLEGGGVKLARAHQHTAGRAAAQVDAVEVRKEALELHAARHGARLVDAEGKQLGAGEVFEAGRGNGEEGEASICQTTHTREILPDRSGIALACLRFQLSELGCKRM